MMYGYRVTTMKEQIRTNFEDSMQGKFFNTSMQELEEVIENMYKGQKLKW